MEKKLNKSQSASLLKTLTEVETVANINEDFVEMNITGKLIQKKDKEISLKSIYELMITKFESIDALMIKNQEDNNERFNSIDNEIKAVKADVKNLDAKVTALDTKVTTLDIKVQKLDTKVSKVIELNKDIVKSNEINVSKENKKWLFSNNGDDNTPTR